MIDINLQPDLKLSLELLLSPRMLQMLKILNLPYGELVEHISKASEENPLLEVERRDEYVEFIRYLTSDRKIKKEADFSEIPGLENISKVSETLENHLRHQLELEDLSDPYPSICKEIIENIDDAGLVMDYPRLREKIMQKASVSRPTVDKALKIVQGFEPEGVGARDLKECLLIQIEAYNFENKALQKILKKAVKDYLEDIGKGDLKKVASALGIPQNGAEEIANFIKNNLNPRPGASFGGETAYVLPSFAVEKTDQGFKLINLETHYGPRINLSPSYLKMLDDPKTDEKTKEFLKTKLRNAKNLIEDFSKRSETLEKIVRKIIESQEIFLRRGMTWLNPLPQKSLADEFGLHPSTISRTVAAKYIQTPQGLYPLKFLCPRGPKGLSVARIKSMLAEIIKTENKGGPLTDLEITESMKKQGARIDRRTVAHYRQELKIPASEARRKNG